MQQSLSYKTLKNAGYSLLNYVWPILFSVFITPVVVHRLGLVQYGIYVLISTLTAFLNLIDVGLLTALVKYAAEYYAQQNFASLERLLGSAQTLYVLVGVVGFGVFFLIGKFFLPFFHIAPQQTGNLFLVFALAGAVFFINSINSVVTAIPIALQRFDIVTNLNLSQLTVLNVAILVLVLLRFHLVAIFAATLVSVIGLSLAYLVYFYRLLPNFNLRFAWDGAELKKAYGFGVFSAITNLAANALIQLDRLIIPAFVGPTLLTYYSLPGNVAQKTSGITGSLGTIFFPLTSALSGSGQLERVKDIYRKTFRNLTVIAAAFTVGIICFAYQILLFWLGKDFADRGSAILVLLAVTYFILALYNPLTNFLLGLGKVRFLMYFSLVLAAANVMLLLVLVPRYGILGAAWAYLGAVILVPFCFYWTEHKFLGFGSMSKFYVVLYGKVLLTGVIAFFVIKWGLVPLARNFWLLLILGPLSVVLFFAFYKILGFFEPEDWALFRSFGQQIINRLKPGHEL